MNPRRSHFSNRPGRSRPPRKQGGDAPVFLGEPSPSLAKINTMNMVKLEAKMQSLAAERTQLAARLEKLNSLESPPQDKIQAVTDLQVRLDALKDVVAKRLAGKAERKAAREQSAR